MVDIINLNICLLTKTDITSIKYNNMWYLIIKLKILLRKININIIFAY